MTWEIDREWLFVIPKLLDRSMSAARVKVESFEKLKPFLIGKRDF
jgi:hypothetical protein